MALLWIEGFTLFNSANSFSLKGYSLSNYGGTYSLPTGRSGGTAKAWRVVNGSYSSGSSTLLGGCLLNIPMSLTSGVAGFAVQFAAVSGYWTSFKPLIFFAVTDAQNNVQFSLGFSNNTTVILCGPRDSNITPIQFTLNAVTNSAMMVDNTGNTTINNLATSSGLTFSTGVWYFLEVVCQSGAVSVYANNSRIINYTGGGTSGVFRNFLYGATSFTSSSSGTITWASNMAASVLFDDIYIMDTSGPTNNARLGDCIVQGIQPVSDNVVQWTRGGSSSPATDAVAVANPDPSITTGYITSSTSGTEDRYTLATASGTVYGVQINWAAQQISSTGRIAPVVNIGGTDYVGNYQNDTAANAVYSQVYNQDPTNTNWTKNTINNATFGLTYITP